MEPEGIRGGSVTVTASWGGWRWVARFDGRARTGRVRLGGEAGKEWALDQGREALEALKGKEGK